MARRIRVGDVIEIITSRGFAYGHITHVHKTERASYGPLVRVLPGFFDSRPGQFDGLVRQSPFWAGDKEWFVGKLKPEQRQIPISGIVDGVLLRERIETGWSPATDPVLR
jgi:hypothetical protein